MNVLRLKLALVLLTLVAGGAMFAARGTAARGGGGSALDDALRAALDEHGFTGRVGQSLEERLGRKVDDRLADLGRLAFHDSLLGLADDNSCAGCHAAQAGFGDTQSVATGVGNNGVAGPDRAGPRNQRRAPMILNNVFYPRLMLNSRFASLSGDPFDPLMRTPVALGDGEFRQLLAFLANGLLDPKARPENLRKLIPARLPSGRPVHNFQP
jgi:cytochrome c peroxidase